MIQDTQGQMHLVWYSDQVQDNYGNPQPGKFLYESIHMQDGWSPPAIFAALSQAAIPSAVESPRQRIICHVDRYWRVHTGVCIWRTSRCMNVLQTRSISLQRQSWMWSKTAQFHPPATSRLSVTTSSQNFVYMPEPNPAFSDLPVTPNGGFDLLRRYIQQTRYELLHLKYAVGPRSG